MSTAAIITVSICSLLAWCATLVAIIQIDETRTVYGANRPKED